MVDKTRWKFRKSFNDAMINNTSHCYLLFLVPQTRSICLFRVFSYWSHLLLHVCSEARLYLYQTLDLLPFFQLIFPSHVFGPLSLSTAHPLI